MARRGFLAPRVIGWDHGAVSFWSTIAAASLAWFAVLVWLYRLVAADGVGASRNAALIVFVTMASFAVELATVGFFVYGQLLALPVPIVAGTYLYRWMRRAT